MREQTAARVWCFTRTRSTVRRAGHACEARVRRGAVHQQAGAVRTGRSLSHTKPVGAAASPAKSPVPRRRPWPCCRAAYCRHPSRSHRRRSQHGHHGDCQVLQAVGAVRRVPRVALLRVRHASRAASTALGVAVCAQWAPLYTSLVFAQWREEGGGNARGRCLRPFSGDGWFHSLLTVDFVQTFSPGGSKSGV